MASTTISQKAYSGELQRIPSFLPRLSIFARVAFAVKLMALKFAIGLGLKMKRKRKPVPPSCLPTLTKSYPIRPHLENRIFYPPNYKPGSGELLPLYLDIHGGGFAILDPEVDDVFCATFAKRFNLLVVAMNYTKPPALAFPGPSHDLAEIGSAIIDDPELPIDKTRVCIGGFSTGGNLALSCVQLSPLKGRVKAIIPWYPEVDWTISQEDKQKTRPVKPGAPEEKDVLASFRDMFNWAYLNDGQDLSDPLLSVAYAKKEDLPPWAFFVCANYDMLQDEGRNMIARIAEKKDLTEEEKWGFEKDTYRFQVVKGANHGFTHHKRQQGEEEERRQAFCESIYPVVGEWLLNGPFKK